jgi:Holliday junction resolvasome RuvABC DNA-binding subunit
MFTEQGDQPEEALSEELDEDKLVRSLMLLGYSEEQAKVVLNKGAQVG